MKLLILALFAATSFAGTIVPNIKWNQIEKNNTGAAAAWGERSNATLHADRATATDSWQWGAQVLASYAGAAIEAGVLADEGLDNQNFDLNLGYAVMPNLAIGLEYDYINHDTGISDASRPSLSVGYKLANGIILGGGFGRMHVNGLPVSSNQLHFGVGHMKDGSTNELVLHYNLEDEDTASGTTMLSSWVVSFDHVCHNMVSKGIQMAANAKVGKVDGGETNWSVQPEFEYMAANHFFPGIFGGYADDGIDGAWNAGLSLRNTHDNFQWLAKAGWAEGDEYKFDLDLSYMF